MRMAAIYARVSSEQQREAHTIASQTAALIELARTLDIEVPTAWIFEDDGYSGATLERPGLERVRDLAAEGQIQTVLVYSPDRLSRKYAYQILLIEELARHGVETRFLNAPQGVTAEDQLLVQFQGMIAEYERAQILERSRRGKRHRARAGEISVLSGAPYGYRYICKSDDAPASYAVIDAEARVVRQVYEQYTVAGWSIGAITRWLNDQRVATRKPGARWERSMVWAMLRNPAYPGTACFGKTRVATRQRVTRPLRMRGGLAARDSANHERPREDWIEIPVPALLDEPTFARAQELLHDNKVRARRRTIAPSLVQGLVSCRRCGYALSRTSTRSSARLIHYYRCIGSDAWRHLGGPRCTSRPVRQDLLDDIVWTEVMRLLEDPTLIQQELDRRLAMARAADPTKQRERTVQRDLVRVGRSIERILTAYQEDLLSLEQLRERMPPLRHREQVLRTELQSIAEQTRERAVYLSLAETLVRFLGRLRVAADTLDILERQRIVRLVVKEVLVADDTIVIRHSIPVPTEPPNGSSPASDPSDDPADNRSYLLRTGRHDAALRRAFRPLFPRAVRPLHRRTKPPGHIKPDPRQVGVVGDGPLDEVMRDGIKEAPDVQIDDPIRRPASPSSNSHRIERGLAGPIAIRVGMEFRFHHRFEDHRHHGLRHTIGHGRNAERSNATVILRNFDAEHRRWKVRAR
jgi:site-specific DNA recombinase